uniref:Uncharacterized protein n=1 Tax=Strongyloides stercoralis TaxID=6248 RepID=A0AAF5DLM0_STRER
MAKTFIVKTNNLDDKINNNAKKLALLDKNNSLSLSRKMKEKETIKWDKSDEGENIKGRGKMSTKKESGIKSSKVELQIEANKIDKSKRRIFLIMSLEDDVLYVLGKSLDDAVN